MTWHGEGWSTTHLIADRTEAPWFNACKDLPGVYRLIGLETAQLPTPAKIARVCGVDEAGTLYIGAAKSLISRVAKLVQQHLKTTDVGGNHKAKCERLAVEFPTSKLAVCWRFIDSAEKVFDTEHELMRAYKAEFGETPPLNSQG